MSRQIAPRNIEALGDSADPARAGRVNAALMRMKKIDLRFPSLAGLYAAAGCLFVALFQFWLPLSGIDRDGTASRECLRIIRYCAIVLSVLYFLGAMPVVCLAADAGDAPGVVLIGAFLDLFPIGVAATAAVLERMIGK